MPEHPAVVASELRAAVGRLSRQLRRLYAASQQPGDVTFLELAILDKLRRSGPLAVSDLARGERVTTQAISAIVRRLRQRELVCVTTDAQDRRRSVVATNDRALQVMADREQRVATQLSSVVADVCSEPDLALLKRAATVLNTITDRIEGQQP